MGLRQGRNTSRKGAAASAAITIGLAGGTLGWAAPVSAQDDPLVGWQHEVTKVLQAQEVTQGKDVTIAISDTGVSPHPYFEDKTIVDGLSITHVIEGLDNLDRESHCGPSWGGGGGEECIGLERTDVGGHGTAMAGVALSVAPKASIMPLRWFLEDEFGSCIADSGLVADQIDWAVDNGADVISMSFGLGCDSPEFRTALQRAAANDVILVAGAGNAGGTVQDSEFPYPALYPGVIVVSATDPGNAVVAKPKYHWASTGGEQVGLAAPGVDYTTLKNQVEWEEDEDGGISANDDPTLYEHADWHGGTSAATAFVAGAAALVRSNHPELSAAGVVNRLVSTAQDLGESGRDSTYGYGLLDAHAAVTASVDPVEENPLGYPLGMPGDPDAILSGEAGQADSTEANSEPGNAESTSDQADQDATGQDGDAGSPAQAAAESGSPAGWGFAGVAVLAAAAAVFFFLVRRPLASPGLDGPSLGPPPVTGDGRGYPAQAPGSAHHPPGGLAAQQPPRAPRQAPGQPPHAPGQPRQAPGQPPHAPGQPPHGPGAQAGGAAGWTPGSASRPKAGGHATPQGGSHAAPPARPGDGPQRHR